MQVTSIFYQQKFAMEHCGGNRFEMVDVGVTVTPSDGQSAAEAFAEAKAFVEARKPNGAAPVMAPRLVQNASGALEPAPAKAEAPPFTPNETPEPPAKRRGRPKKGVKEANDAIAAVEASNTLDDFAANLNAARKVAGVLDTDAWEAALSRCKVRYTQINSADADPEVVTKIIAAFKAERTAIDSKRSAQTAA